MRSRSFHFPCTEPAKRQINRQLFAPTPVPLWAAKELGDVIDWQTIPAEIQATDTQIEVPVPLDQPRFFRLFRQPPLLDNPD